MGVIRTFLLRKWEPRAVLLFPLLPLPRLCSASDLQLVSFLLSWWASLQLVGFLSCGSKPVIIAPCLKTLHDPLLLGDDKAQTPPMAL